MSRSGNECHLVTQHSCVGACGQLVVEKQHEERQQGCSKLGRDIEEIAQTNNSCSQPSPTATQNKEAFGISLAQSHDVASCVVHNSRPYL